jgi:hypothetical protein
MMCEQEFDFPHGPKPNVYGARSGTAEAVPFQIAFMRPDPVVLEAGTHKASRDVTEGHRLKTSLAMASYLLDYLRSRATVGKPSSKKNMWRVYDNSTDCFITFGASVLFLLPREA